MFRVREREGSIGLFSRYFSLSEMYSYFEVTVTSVDQFVFSPELCYVRGVARGGHSHRRLSHGCDRGQEAVKGSRAVFGVGQAVKDNFQTW